MSSQWSAALGKSRKREGSAHPLVTAGIARRNAKGTAGTWNWRSAMGASRCLASRLAQLVAAGGLGSLADKAVSTSAEAVDVAKQRAVRR